ncbi:hypothetical protein B5K08_24835 [Rhizobium leguminosarum bv. trifolii]|uniref:SCP2 domain-containing protein n=3 Tax=Rhizobium TaxID=379 RepID=A0A7W8X7E1_9HYPH|nr:MULTISPECIES: hypothetical protein [Rhizobium]KPH05166.1 hypothetical protein AOG23_29290 [Rhizobium acidisoli]MBB5536165.1 hypothetical protein [Rhizobium giardinii]QAS81104.1 hypothetical protein CO657_24315 [Rhizobium acidisoli]RFB86503.1 hypothetical protein B5K08_24835 [Rhizobium leguminosarum bv. trifolii]RFB86763.1 hypothetical protein B5K10_24825 [Rhizobium leguminosarum bv. trifolii]
MAIDLEKFKKLALEDFEFKRETRYLNGIIKCDFPTRSVALHFEDGKMVKVEEAAYDDEECKIVIRGTGEQWEALLQKKPQPFYQCLQSSNIKHGLYLSNNHETFAYLPALNRMTNLMREARPEGVAA